MPKGPSRHGVAIVKSSDSESKRHSLPWKAECKWITHAEIGKKRTSKIHFTDWLTVTLSFLCQVIHMKPEF